MATIRCGNRAAHSETTHHDSIENVRRCFSTETETWACTWLVQRRVEDAETGPWTLTEECGGLSWYLADGRGYECENGHDHIYDEVRVAEGWDYVADPQEAGLLAGRGARPVAMDGGEIDIDMAAYAYAAGL